MVTLFDRWNKRLLLAKVLVGANGFSAVNFWNYKRFSVWQLHCPLFPLFGFLLSCETCQFVFFEPGFENCVRAVWCKPVQTRGGSFSAWVVAMVDVFYLANLEPGYEFGHGC